MRIEVEPRRKGNRIRSPRKIFTGWQIQQTKSSYQEALRDLFARFTIVETVIVFGGWSSRREDGSESRKKSPTYIFIEDDHLELGRGEKTDVLACKFGRCQWYLYVVSYQADKDKTIDSAVVTEHFTPNIVFL